MTIRQSEIAKDVSTALGEDERTEDAVVEVIEQNGIVTLSGEVASATVREAAEAIARSQEGVLDVVNDLAVAEEAKEEGTDKVVVPAVNVPGSAGSREGYIPR